MQARMLDIHNMEQWINMNKTDNAPRSSMCCIRARSAVDSTHRLKAALANWCVHRCTKRSITTRTRTISWT